MIWHIKDLLLQDYILYQKNVKIVNQKHVHVFVKLEKKISIKRRIKMEIQSNGQVQNENWLQKVVKKNTADNKDLTEENKKLMRELEQKKDIIDADISTHNIEKASQINADSQAFEQLVDTSMANAIGIGTIIDLMA
jgi:DNA-directed RNA polymerase subunit L